jgi:prevent-host-death family protein
MMPYSLLDSTSSEATMFRVNGATTVATVTDLRRSANELLQRAEAGESVVVQRNAEAVGVLVGYETFQKLMDLAERVDDLELLLLARKRERAIRRGEDKLIPLEEVMREFGMEPGAGES